MSAFSTDLGCPKRITFRRHNKKQLSASHPSMVNRTEDSTISTAQLSWVRQSTAPHQTQTMLFHSFFFSIQTHLWNTALTLPKQTVHRTIAAKSQTMGTAMLLCDFSSSKRARIKIFLQYETSSSPALLQQCWEYSNFRMEELHNHLSV